MAGCCVSDPAVAPLLPPPQAANESDSMPEPLNEVPAKSGKKRGRGACAPANRRPFRTLDGTKQAKASAGEFLVLFAAKKYKVPRGRRPRLTADQKRQTTPVADCDQDFLRPNSIWKSPRQGAVPGPPFPQNQSLFSALEPDLRILVWWSREKSLPLKVICSNR